MKSYNQFRSEVAIIWKTQSGNGDKYVIVSSAWVEYKAMFSEEMKSFYVYTKGGHARVFEKSPVAAWYEAERLGWNPINKMPFTLY